MILLATIHRCSSSNNLSWRRNCKLSNRARITSLTLLRLTTTTTAIQLKKMALDSRLVSSSCKTLTWRHRQLVKAQRPRKFQNQSTWVNQASELSAQQWTSQTISTTSFTKANSSSMRRLPRSRAIKIAIEYASVPDLLAHVVTLRRLLQNRTQIPWHTLIPRLQSKKPVASDQALELPWKSLKEVASSRDTCL